MSTPTPNPGIQAIRSLALVGQIVIDEVLELAVVRPD